MKEKIKQEMINDIMNDINFEDIHKAMLATDWKWAEDGGKLEVPGLCRIIERAKWMLSQIMYGNRHFIASGGFEAELDEEGVLSLRFVLDQSATYPDDYKN